MTRRLTESLAQMGLCELFFYRRDAGATAPLILRHFFAHAWIASKKENVCSRLFGMKKLRKSYRIIAFFAIAWSSFLLLNWIWVLKLESWSVGYRHRLFDATQQHGAARHGDTRRGQYESQDNVADEEMHAHWLDWIKHLEPTSKLDPQIQQSCVSGHKILHAPSRHTGGAVQMMQSIWNNPTECTDWLRQIMIDQAVEELPPSLRPEYIQKDAYHTLPYYRLSRRPRDLMNQITLVTHGSLDKLYMLPKIVRAWNGGAISLALFCTNLTQDVQTIHATMQASPRIFRDVDIHLVVQGSALDTAYPFNHLRNLALEASRTRFNVLLDIDFIPNPDCESQLTHLLGYQRWRNKLMNEKEMFVLPAFQRLYVKEEEHLGINLLTLPANKETLLLELHRSDAVYKPFHLPEYPRGHGPTNYDMWMNLNLSEPYSIQYENQYEPYVLMYKSPELPRYFEDFVGFGWNKQSWFLELAKYAGYRFRVVPFSFVVHMDYESYAQRLTRRGHFQASLRNFKAYIKQRYSRKSRNFQHHNSSSS